MQNKGRERIEERDKDIEYRERGRHIGRESRNKETQSEKKIERWTDREIYRYIENERYKQREQIETHRLCFLCTTVFFGNSFDFN